MTVKFDPKHRDVLIANVLGEDWTIEFRSIEEDDMLETRYGYCSKSKRLIVLQSVEESDHQDPINHAKMVLRHELIHAAFFESGLIDNNTWDEEQTVDWIAIQFPKLKKTFESLGIV